MLDMLELINARLIEENDSALIAVYAVNQKGKSLSVIVRDLNLGSTAVKLDRGNEVRPYIKRYVERERETRNAIKFSFPSLETLIITSSQDSTPYFIGIVITILIVFIFIALKMMSICWEEKSSKSTRTTSSAAATAAHNEQNGTTKLTNHSNNLLIISSYNGSLTKVSLKNAITPNISSFSCVDNGEKELD